jgi:hypothetical protein
MDCTARPLAGSSLWITGLLGSVVLVVVGCASPYSPYCHTDEGAVAGGLLGAGTGAIVGHALGNTGAGALVGAGVGVLGGAAVGSSIDESEARNRAIIAARLGRQLAAGAVSPEDVAAMTRAGVNEEVIDNQIRAHGVTRPLVAGDLIALQQQGVTPRVIEVMQQSLATQTPAAVCQPYDPYAYPGYYYRPYYYSPYGYYYPPPPPAVGFGVQIR